MAELKTEKVTAHTLTLTDAELNEWREAARCALDLGGDKDEHAATWRTIARLGLSPTRHDAHAHEAPSLHTNMQVRGLDLDQIGLIKSKMI